MTFALIILCIALAPIVHILLTKRLAKKYTFELPAWSCPKCRAFNGEAKEKILACRCCGAARP